jgi:hypothetical protein
MAAMTNLDLMPKVNYTLVAKNLDLPILPTYFSWNSIVKGQLSEDGQNLRSSQKVWGSGDTIFNYF